MKMSLLFNLYKLLKIQIMWLGDYKEKDLQGWSYKNRFYGGYDIWVVDEKNLKRTWATIFKWTCVIWNQHLFLLVTDISQLRALLESSLQAYQAYRAG